MTTCVGPCRRRPTEPKTDSWRDGNIKFHVKLISLGSANGVLSGVQLNFKLHLFRKFFVFVISLSHSRLLRFGLGESICRNKRESFILDQTRHTCPQFEGQCESDFAFAPF